jgi:glycosyltransferase involved in cell wall biosynthesis
MGSPFLIFDTHPIQYRSPLFQEICRRDPTAKVYFFQPGFDGGKWWFKERGAIPKQTWEVPLQEGFPNETLGLDTFPPWRRWRILKRLLEEQRPRAVLLFGYYLPENWMLWITARRLGIPVVFLGETFQEDFLQLRTIVSRPLRLQFLKGLTRIVSIGRRNHDYYRKLGIPESILVSGKYAVNNQFFLVGEAERRAARAKVRERLRIPADAFVTLFVGRLFERKRPKDLFHIHQRVNDRRYHTIVVGNGPQEDFMRDLAHGVGRFHLVGFQNQGQTREYYCAADVLCVPSEFETWGLVVNEAFCAGIPAIVSEDCGVAGDLVTPGETGFIFAIGDIEAAARHIGHLMDGTWDARAMGRNAQERVQRDFNLEQLASAVIRASGTES